LPILDIYSTLASRLDGNEAHGWNYFDLLGPRRPRRMVLSFLSTSTGRNRREIVSLFPFVGEDDFPPYFVDQQSGDRSWETAETGWSTHLTNVPPLGQAGATHTHTTTNMMKHASTKLLTKS
jgi:hypothetical protein